MHLNFHLSAEIGSSHQRSQSRAGKVKVRIFDHKSKNWQKPSLKLNAFLPNTGARTELKIQKMLPRCKTPRVAQPNS